MSVRAFLDTNVLLYACSAAEADRSKRDTVRQLLALPHVTVSSQVLQEFIANALRKPQLGIGEEIIEAYLEFFRPDDVQAVDLSLVREGTRIRQRFQLSHWDSTIVAAALRKKCGVLYSEDLQDGQRFGDLEVKNPFR